MVEAYKESLIRYNICMKIERTKNTIRNTKWGIAQKFVNLLLPFVVRTVLIHTLSAEYAGLSSLFTSILQILSLTELGFSSAIVYSMYKPIAEDDRDKICALLNLYKKAYRIIGAVILGVGIAILPILPHLINGGTPSDVNLYLLYIIYLANTVISYFLFAYKTSLLSAFQREDVISKNTLVINAMMNLLQCIVLLIFRNYYAFSIIIPLSSLILNFINNHSVSRIFPDYAAEGRISEEEKKELKKNLTGLMILKVGGATRNTLDSIVVSSYLGLVAVAMYNNYFYVVNGVNAFLGVINISMSAGVGNKIVTESPEHNYEDFQKFHFLYMWIAGVCTVCMMCLYQPFMKLWMGIELMLPDTVMFLFCYYFLMMKQGDINSIYYQAAGLWWQGKYRSVIEAILNLILNFLLGKFFGIIGILLATIISYTCVYFYGSKFIFTEYFKNGKLGKFIIKNLEYMLVTIITGFLTYEVCNLVTSSMKNQYSRIIVMSCIAVTVTNVMFYLLYSMDKDNKEYIQSIMLCVKAAVKK